MNRDLIEAVDKRAKDRITDYAQQNTLVVGHVEGVTLGGASVRVEGSGRFLRNVPALQGTELVEEAEVIMARVGRSGWVILGATERGGSVTATTKSTVPVAAPQNVRYEDLEIGAALIEWDASYFDVRAWEIVIGDVSDGDHSSISEVMTDNSQYVHQAGGGTYFARVRAYGPDWYRSSWSDWIAFSVSSVGGGGVTDHGELDGLGDDDHTQYLLANGTRNLSGDLLIYDGVTDSPKLKWKTGSADEFALWAEDAGADLVLKFPDAAGASSLTFRDSGDSNVGKIDSDAGMYLIGHVAFGNNVSAPATNSVVKASEDIDTTAAFYGFFVDVRKKYGVTDASDNIQGARFIVYMWDTDSTIGNLIGIGGESTMYYGTCTDVSGGSFKAAQDGGTVSGNYYGIKADVDLSAGTPGVNAYGAHVEIDVTTSPSGSVYGYYLLETAGADYGFYQNGSADNVIGGKIRSTGSTFPDLGTTTLAEKLGHIYLGTKKDTYAYGDTRPVFDRCTNWGRVPDEHWLQGADDLTWNWANYTGFTTSPAGLWRTISMLRVGDTSDTKAFYYRAYTNGYAEIYARCGVTINVRAGLMVDDGSNAGDGEGANNFYRFMIEKASGVNYVRFVREYRTGGGAVTSTTFTYYLVPGQYVGLCLVYGIGTRWTSWGAAGYCIGEQQSSVNIVYNGGIGFSWTPARHGLYFDNLQTGTDKQALFDWFEE